MNRRSALVLGSGIVLGWSAVAVLDWAGVPLAWRWVLTVVMTVAAVACFVASRRK